MSEPLSPSLSQALPKTQERAHIGIAVRNNVNCRLIESASRQLGLQPVMLDTKGGQFTADDFLELELILAEEDIAQQINATLQKLHRQDDPYRPAVIAVIPFVEQFDSSELERSYDGVLPLPQAPAIIAAQLGIALYAYKAFARRYDDTIEELRRNRQIFHSVTSGISVASATDDLPLTYVNPAFEVMTGYSLEESIGRNCRFLQREDRNQPGLDVIRKAVREGAEAVAVLHNYRKDGTPFWNELAMSPIRDRSGKITHFVGIQTDVTARVEFENALRESEKLAVVGRLSASISHEINNPLESVTNLVYLALHSDDLDESRGFLQQADQELKRVKLITSQSLRFYRQSTAPTSVQMSELLDSVLDMQHAHIAEAGVSVERRERLKEPVLCLESEIRQVLNNLIANAVDAMRATGGRLMIRTSEAACHAAGERCAVITIADTGAGIPPESLPNLYRAFYSTKGDKGNGLGLWISSGIVNRHQGTLRVRTRHGSTSSGTVFRLLLPVGGAETYHD